MNIPFIMDNRNLLKTSSQGEDPAKMTFATISCAVQSDREQERLIRAILESMRDWTETISS